MVISRHPSPPASAARIGDEYATPAASGSVSGRILGRDRLSDGVLISVELGPLDVPDRAEVVAAVRTLIGLGPAARAGRRLAGGRWTYDPAGLDEQAERIVRSLPDHLTGDRGVPRLREAIEPDLPFTVFLGRDRASLCIDHRLGDGFLSVMITAAVLAGRGVPSVFASARDGDPLRAALGATFGRHASRVAALVRDRVSAPPPARPEVTVDGDRGSLDLVTAVMDGATFRSLAAWSRGRVPPTLTMMFALRAALQRVGIPVLDDGGILVDLRRYLPSGHSTLANFVVGHPVSVAGGIDAAGARFSHDLHVGRPLAAATVGLLTRPWHGFRAPRAARAPLAAHPIVSDMGFLRALEPLPWASEEPTVRVSVDPAGRNGITALTAVLRRRMNVSVSFDGSLYDRALVREACRLLCSDPEGLLT